MQVAFAKPHFPGGEAAALSAVMAAVYLQTGSLLLPVVLHALIDLRFLLVPARVLPAGRTA